MLTVLRHSQRSAWTSEARVATGRSAILHMIKTANPKAVLMPCYVPEGVIIPFQRVGIPIKFYKLREDLRPDLDHVTRLMSKGALFVLIHYFGWQTETGALREIVSNAKGILFEDCAHALFAKALDADVALWCLNKFLPVVDGAILKSRRRDIDVSHPISQTLQPRVLNSYHQHLDLNARLAVCIDPDQIMDLAEESNLAYEEYYKEIKDLIIYAQSSESRCIVESTNLEAVRTARSHNAASYYKMIPECFLFRPKPPLAPFAYPIIVRPPLKPEQVFNRLLEVGVLASKLMDKWNHVPGDPRFTAERTFMEQHLLLPVGEEVAYNDIRRISECLKGISGAH